MRQFNALELLYLNRAACAQGQFPEKLYKSHVRILQNWMTAKAC